MNGLLDQHAEDQRGSLKDALACHLEVIEWAPEPADPLRATMRLMPFAGATPPAGAPDW